jgi:hypothetical protein
MNAFSRCVTSWLSLTLAVGSLLSCGGRVQDSFPSAGGSSGLANEPPGGTASSGGSPTAGSGANAGAEVCERALGEEPIGHACTHTTNGPFDPVVAGSGFQPPDVSELHHTYEVQVVGPGARLRYRAQRQGEHAFMTDSFSRVELSQAGRPLSASPGVRVVGCGHLAWATVYPLEPEAEYELLLLETAPDFALFVEHLGAFGSGAWAEPCRTGD